MADIHGISVRQTRQNPPTLSRQQQAMLLNWLYKDLTTCNLGILLSLYTGIRLGELCALKWKDVSPVDQSISIYQTMQRVQRQEGNRTEVIVQPPKSASAVRIIPVTRELAVLLKKHRREEDAYLLTGRADRFMEPRTLQRRFKKALKEVGLNDINFHALRHPYVKHKTKNILQKQKSQTTKLIDRL